MLGTGLHVTRSRGEDRFYNPAKAHRAHQNQKSTAAAEQLRRAQNDVTPSQSHREQENRTGSKPWRRRPDEDSDSNFRDSSSDGSSDFESDRIKYLRKPQNHQMMLSEIPLRRSALSTSRGLFE